MENRTEHEQREYDEAAKLALEILGAEPEPQKVVEDTLSATPDIEAKAKELIQVRALS